MGDKILIIDQSQHFLDMLTIRLMNCGYDQFRTARNGNEGLSIAELEEPSLVIVDARLPDTTGYEMCKQIKALYGHKTQVILMTSLAGRYNMKRAIQSGADEYVIKTYDCLFLMAAIKRLLSRKGVGSYRSALYNPIYN